MRTSFSQAYHRGHSKLKDKFVQSFLSSISFYTSCLFRSLGTTLISAGGYSPVLFILIRSSSPRFRMQSFPALSEEDKNWVSCMWNMCSSPWARVLGSQIITGRVTIIFKSANGRLQLPLGCMLIYLNNVSENLLFRTLHSKEVGFSPKWIPPAWWFWNLGKGLFQR